MDTPESYDVEKLKEQLLALLGEEHAHLYPVQVEQMFPRILDKIVTYWGKPGLDAYLDQLMVTDRPGRQGFPGAVAMEIFRLSTVHGSLGLSRVQQGTGWSGVEDAELYRKAIKKEI